MKLDNALLHAAVRQAFSEPRRATPAPDPIKEWESAITSRVTAGVTRAAAIASLMRERPELAGQYDAAKNAQRTAILAQQRAARKGGR